MSTDWNENDVGGNGGGDAGENYFLDSEGVDSNALDSAITVDKPGKYHFEIVAVLPRLERYRDGDMTKPQYPHLLVISEVLESVPGQSPAGTVYYQELAFAGKGGGPFTEEEVRMRKEPTFAFLKGIGLYVDAGGKLVNRITSSTKVVPSELQTQLMAMQWIGHIKDDSYPNKQTGVLIPSFKLKYGKGAFKVDDSKVSTVPKNKAKLAEIGMSHVSAGEMPKPAAAPATQMTIPPAGGTAGGQQGNPGNGNGGSHSTSAAGTAPAAGGLAGVDL